MTPVLTKFKPTTVTASGKHPDTFLAWLVLQYVQVTISIHIQIRKS